MTEKRIECQPRAIPYPGPHVTRMEVLFYKFVEFIFETLQAIIHFVVAIKFWRKGESVPPVNNPLLLKSATKLAEEIRAGELRSEVVVRAYINRIRTVDPYVNATVNRCFEQALKEAMEADSLIASGRYTKEQLAKEKPLLGVPLTVKTFLRVKGALRSHVYLCLYSLERGPKVKLQLVVPSSVSKCKHPTYI